MYDKLPIYYLLCFCFRSFFDSFMGHIFSSQFVDVAASRDFSRTFFGWQDLAAHRIAGVPRLEHDQDAYLVLLLVVEAFHFCGGQGLLALQP